MHTLKQLYKHIHMCINIRTLYICNQCLKYSNTYVQLDPKLTFVWTFWFWSDKRPKWKIVFGLLSYQSSTLFNAWTCYYIWFHFRGSGRAKLLLFGQHILACFTVMYFKHCIFLYIDILASSLYDKSPVSEYNV